MADKFTTLVEDLKLLVLDHIPRPSDLKALCLTHRKLQAAVMPKFYRTVELKIDSQRPQGFVGFCRTNHPGHKHVVELIFTNQMCRAELNGREWDIIKFAIRVIPENQLKKISFPSLLVLDPQTFLCLCKSQNQLTDVTFGPVDTTLSHTFSLPSFSETWFQQIKTLELPYEIHSEHDIRGFQQVIQHCRGLKKLIVGINRMEKSAGVENRNTRRTDLVPRLLFSHIAPRGDEPPLKLRELTIRWAWLDQTGNDFTRAINFSQLTSLVLRDCKERDGFLHSLATLSSAHGCALKRLHISDDNLVESSGPDISKFLRTFIGLEDFHMDERASYIDILGLVLAILGHRATLKKLHFRVRYGFNYAEDVIIANELQAHLINEATGLQDLAIIFPHVRVDSKPETDKDWGDFGIQLNAAATAPALRQLRILHWPWAPERQFTLPRSAIENEQTYLAMLDEFAVSVFHRIAAVKGSDSANDLPHLWFGATDPHPNVESVDAKTGMGLSPVCYVPSMRYVENAPSQFVPVRKTIWDMSYIVSGDWRGEYDSFPSCSRDFKKDQWYV